MSIAAALSSALSGMTATSRQAEVLSSNVANATTSGYGRRSVALTALYLGGTGQGVRIAGVIRHSDLSLLNDRRLAQAAQSAGATRANFMLRLEGVLGTPESEGSLTSRLDQFDSALLSAAANPESEAQLKAAVQAAHSLSLGLNQASQSIQNERLVADKSIAAAVTDLNAALVQIAKLNASIAAFDGSGRDASAFIDQRQQVIDAVADLIPLRQLPRQDGQIALISSAGAVLLDGRAAVFGFTGVNMAVAEMTIGSGALAGLTLNGRDMAISGSSSLLRGGKLAAMFDIRDTFAGDAQSRVDAVARDLIERFSAPGVDPSLIPGAAGLFTDGGGALDPSLELGLAGRIRLHQAVSYEHGGSPLALRDGLAASGAVYPGDASLLLSLSEALNRGIPTASSGFALGIRTAAELFSELLSGVSSDRVTLQGEQAFASARFAAFSDLEARDAVDIDAEMQTLLVIEKNYAANAKVIQTVDDMLKLLLGL